MLIINKLADGAGFSVKDGGDSVILYKEPFSPTAIGDEVTIRSQLRNVQHRAPYNEVTIDGATFESAADVHHALSFLTSFKNGGGSSPSPTPAPDRNKPILLVDYDGRLLHSYTREEAQALSALPGLPTHEYLTGTGWTHTLEQVKAAQALHVGAMYRTMNGKTYAFVTLTAVSGLALPLYVYLMEGATVRVDWGDGQTQDTSSEQFMTIHNYAIPGDYVITIERISSVGFYEFGWGTSQYVFVGGTTDYKKTLTKLYVGDNANIIKNSFGGCATLSAITIPSGTTAIENNAFSSCFSLRFVALPATVESIGSGSFQTCYALQSIILPRGLTSIENAAFGTCYNLREYLFESETPPTLLGTAVFNGISPISKIYVPDASVEAYKTAPNWATYANYIHPISERP